MGAFFTNLHMRCESSDTVAGVISDVITQPAYVSDSTNGWVSVFPQETEDQNTDRLEVIASKLSRILETPVLATMVHDSDIFLYWLFDNGNRIDQYNSAPEYFEAAGAAAKAEYRGDESVLARFKWSTATAAEIDEVLHSEDRPIFAEETTRALARLLGLSVHRAQVGFNYVGDQWPAADGTITMFRPDGTFEVREQAEPSEDAAASCAAKPIERPLWLLAATAAVEEVKRSIAAGADPNSGGDVFINGAPNVGGRTCLMAACAGVTQSGGRLVKVVKMLVDAGADVNAVDAQGRTALDYALAKRADLEAEAERERPSIDLDRYPPQHRKIVEKGWANIHAARIAMHRKSVQTMDEIMDILRSAGAST